jgi:hypothetical protein
MRQGCRSFFQGNAKMAKKTKKNVVKSRINVETFIQNPVVHEAYFKALEAGKRLPELESIILTDSWSSYLYALHIIKGRWIEAEDIIMTTSNDSYCYAVNIIRGKLPEKMHNMMILHAIEDPDDLYNNLSVKDYFELIK